MNIAPDTLVVCHDAGGAQIMAAFIAEQADRSRFLCCVAGPAAAIFENFHISAMVLSPVDTPEKIFVEHPSIRRLLAGSSWSTKLELNFIAGAKSQKIPTVVYLDHWLNFRERFGFPAHHWADRLPDEFWAGDEYAYSAAQKFFPNKKVTLQPNRYFIHLKEQANAAARQYAVETNRLLWISEPFSEAINPFGVTARYPITEYQTLLILARALANLSRPWHLVIRLHPSERPDKYAREFADFPQKLLYSQSNEPDLLIDIAQARAVVGFESMALVVAMLAGKPVASFVPSEEYHCLLPFPQIKKLTTVEGLEEFLSG